MAAYRLPPNPPHLLKQRGMLAARFLIVAGLAALVLVRTRTTWLIDLGRLTALYAAATLYLFWQRARAWAARGSTVVEVSAEGVRLTTSRRERVLPREEIKSVVDRPNNGGLLVVSARPQVHRSVVIPADLEGFDACRAEILALGAPLVPADPHARGKLIGVGLVVWAFVGAFIAQSTAIRVAGGALAGAVMLTMWALGWTKPRTGQTCGVPDRSPEAQARSRRTTQRWGIGLTAAGIVVMMLEAWWTHGTDDLALGFAVTAVGIIVYAVGYFSGTLASSILAFLALVASGAALDGLTRVLVRGSDLGDLIAMTVAIMATLCFLVSLFGRSEKLMAILGHAIGPSVLAFGAFGQYRRHDGIPMVTAGLVITILALWEQSGWRPDWLKILQPAVRWAAVAIGFFAWTMGHHDLSSASLLLFWCTFPSPGVRPKTSPSAGLA